MADMCRAISVPCEIGFMCAKSYYQGTVSTGIVNITLDLDQDISGYHVIIVEDIIDTGLTLSEVIKEFKKREIASYEVVTLVDKPEGRKVEGVNAKYSGFNIPNKFVIGFGLDYNEVYRNLPYIGVLKRSVYEK